MSLNISELAINIQIALSPFKRTIQSCGSGELVANCDRLDMLKHSSVNPYVFTEQGVVE